MPESQPEVLLEADVVERIRTIFLQPRPHVSIAEGTALLGWTRSEMSEAIRSGEIEVERSCVDTWIWREELMAKAPRRGRWRRFEGPRRGDRRRPAGLRPPHRPCRPPSPLSRGHAGAPGRAPPHHRQR